MNVEKRQYARVTHQQQVSLKTASGLELLAMSHNISLRGMEIRCDAMTASSIKPVDYQLAPNKALVISVSFCLQDGQPFFMTCDVRNTYRLAQELFSFNLAFADIEASDIQRLERFFDK